MARVIREEVQDKDGNIHYFHTEDCIVFDENGISLREAMGKVQFEDYAEEGEGAEVPDAETALAEMTKGKKWTALFSNIKAFCKGVVLMSRVLDSENITEDGFLMSGKTCSKLFQEVNAKIQGTILWENPNPSVAFAEHIITLSSADYDYLEFYYKDSSGKGNVSYQKITKALLRTVSGVSLTIATWTRNPDKSLLLARGINYISDTELKVLDAFTESGINNVFVIPILIIGY